MEVVHIFNKELKSILEAKLPVSRHKMSLITKSAMKALKFYKHVVQSVEKFIAKCSCDYKVPGLYVIDAIVRQSKHQYCDKDVFVPRFMRNIVTTFIHLSQCDPKDLISIERVLRLWQQNAVFPTDLVESLLELVYDSCDNEKIVHAGTIVLRLVNEWNFQKGKPEEHMDVFVPNMESIIPINDNTKTEGGLIDSITKLLTRFQAETGQDVSIEIAQIQILHQKIVEQSALLSQGEMIDSDTLSQLHQSMEELTKKAAKAAAVQQSKLAMLASDDKDHMNEASTDLEFVEQLQQMVDTLGQTRVLQEELKQAMESKQNEVADVVTVAAVDHDFRHVHMVNDTIPVVSVIDEPEEDEETCTIVTNEDLDLRVNYEEQLSTRFDNHSDHNSLNDLSFGKLSRTSSVNSRKRRRSGSETDYGKRHRSRSREHKRKEIKNLDLRERYMPMVRDQCVGIISHTMFIGHLHKHVSESKLRTICEAFGPITEFNMIPPRGCAFVTFEKRKSTFKAVSKMNDMKFEGRNLKVAWAPNKGVKDEKEFRENWVENEGCTYIPIDQFPINRSSDLTEGSAELDDDSLTEELKQAIYQFEQQKSDAVIQAQKPPSAENLSSEVVHQSLPLLSSIVSVNDPSTSYYNHYSSVPPMMPALMSFPPPPPPPSSHMMIGAQSMPTMTRCPDISLANPMLTMNNNYVDYQGLMSPTEPVYNNGHRHPMAPGAIRHRPETMATSRSYSPHTMMMMSPRGPINDHQQRPPPMQRGPPLAHVINHQQHRQSPPFQRPPAFGVPIVAQNRAPTTPGSSSVASPGGQYVPRSPMPYSRLAPPQSSSSPSPSQHYPVILRPAIVPAARPPQVPRF